MKKSLLLLFSLALFTACSGDSNTQSVNDDQQLPTANKVLLLKVDLLTNAFEGGKELTFPDNGNFTISTDFNPAGDFGDITLIYEEVSETIFAGDIIWMGLGQMTFPESINTPEEFTVIQNPVSQPDESQFALVSVDEPATSPFLSDIDYEAIWSSISNLAVVKQYRESNPDAKINLFLYTPSVGVGDPAEWDWFVILKN
ncbi:hypothetical protein Q763_16015 [Flavobacterium beibuense F44-8]|uniref:Uncharacterized protein n=1 Tax=Flavobacterium beibuense F44-8 TaxID=1406840 RepID=A0A0A2LRR7_9FLAO|nr:hypothetical protein [Flavobacterium beibuense]KGO78895.1 hypothetical protein Q763_16015 [Flavobacterium beibuense F44-8]